MYEPDEDFGEETIQVVANNHCQLGSTHTGYDIRFNNGGTTRVWMFESRRGFKGIFGGKGSETRIAQKLACRGVRAATRI